MRHGRVCTHKLGEYCPRLRCRAQRAAPFESLRVLHLWTAELPDHGSCEHTWAGVGGHPWPPQKGPVSQTLAW
jgi:hypothetical protein